MEQLFTPDIGLMVWTVVTFLLLVWILTRFGWGPIVAAIEAREERLRQEREAAERARADAERIQKELEARLAEIDAKARETLARAGKEAEALMARHTAQAQQEARKLMDKTRAELEEEKRRLIVELRTEVASLAMQAAEKLVHKTVDEQVRKSTMDRFFKELEETKKS